MSALLIIILILAVLLVIFTLQNSMSITINVFFWEITNAPLVLVLICCLALGYVVAILYFYPRLWKLKREYNQIIKFNNELQELHKMNHPEKQEKGHIDNDVNAEGIELEDDDDTAFFKD